MHVTTPKGPQRALFQLVFNVTNACCSLSCEPPAYPPASQYNLGTGGPAIYSPLQYSAPPPPSFSSSSPQAPAPGFMPQYTQQPLYPPPSMGQPVSSAPPFSPPPLSSGASFQHGGPGSPASYMPPLPPTGSSGTQPDPGLWENRCDWICSKDPHYNTPPKEAVYWTCILKWYASVGVGT